MLRYAHMHIEWNRVTWYSWLAAVIVFGGALAIGFYLGARWEQVHIERALTQMPASTGHAPAVAQ